MLSLDSVQRVAFARDSIKQCERVLDNEENHELIDAESDFAIGRRHIILWPIMTCLLVPGDTVVARRTHIDTENRHRARRLSGSRQREETSPRGVACSCGVLRTTLGDGNRLRVKAVSRPDVTSPLVVALDMATSLKGEAEDISEVLFSQEALQKRIAQLGALVPSVDRVAL